MDVVKPQPTIKGYNAWVLNRLMESKGTTLAETSAWVIDRWIDDNREFLIAEFRISREQFQQKSKVVRLRQRP